MDQRLVWMEQLETRRLLAFPVQDITFGDLGLVQPTTDAYHGMLQRPGGQLVTFGPITAYGSGYSSDGPLGRVSQFDAHGKLDPSFGGTGTRKLPFSPSTATFDPAGNLLLVGLRNYLSSPVVLARIKPDGALDESFGRHGIVTIPVPEEWLFRVFMGLKADGSILVFAGIDSGENNTSGSTVIYQLKSDGTLDKSFGTNGRRTLIDSGVVSFATLNDGGFVLAGGGAGGNENRHFIIRLDNNGVIDPTFDADAFVPDGIDAPWPPETIAVDAQNRVYVDQADKVYRLTPSGAVDSSFGSGGFVDLSSEQTLGLIPAGIAERPDGKIDIVAAANGTADDRVLYRFNEDGSKDESFGEHGVKLLLGADTDYVGMPVAVLPEADGAVIVLSGVGIERFGAAPTTLLADDGTLYVQSDTASQVISLAQSNKSAVLTIDGQAQQFALDAVKRFGAVLTGTGTKLTVSLNVPARVRGKSTSNQQITTAGGDDQIDFIGAGYSYGGKTTINSGAGNDTISGATDATIDSGDGDDDLQNVSGTIVTGEGNDTIAADGGGSLDSGAGNDLITGGFASITAGDGNDTIYASDSAEGRYDGGAGDDIIEITGYADGTPTTDLPVTTLLGGDGNDLLSAAYGSFSLVGGNGNDLLRAFGRAGDETDSGFIHYAESQTLIGGNGDDTMFGGDYADTFYGNAGNDRIHLNSGGDYASGGGGNDRFYGTGVIRCGPGDDRVIGGGNSSVWGGDGNDLIDSAAFADGGNGNDTLSAATGGATLDGGAGDDVLFTRNDAIDTVTGGDGDDTVTADASLDVLTSIEHQAN